jgi:hypothetical protein
VSWRKRKLSYAKDPNWRDLVLFHEYLPIPDAAAEASHQTGWTSLAVRCLENLQETLDE